MQLPACVLHIANIFRIPVIAGGTLLAAFLAFSAAPAHAACTVGGGAAIDGFAVGASVTCPTGTVQAGTVPPDGSTITNKNVAGGSTTFSYTTPAAGSVQLAGTVNLTAATGAPLSSAGAAAVANNNAQVQALFGGGNGGPTISHVPVDGGTTIGPPVDPTLSTQLQQQQNTLQRLTSDLDIAQQQLESVAAYFDEFVQREAARLDSLNAGLTVLQNDTSNSGINHQNLIDRQERAIAAQEEQLSRIVNASANEVLRSSSYLEVLRERISQVRQRIGVINNQMRSAANGPAANPFTSLFKPGKSTANRDGALNAFTSSFRLSQLLLQARDTRLGQTETNEPLFRRPPELPSALDMFANVSYSDVENDANGAGYESKSWQGTVGLDYRLTRAWALGVFTAFTSNTSKTATINSNSDSFSYLVGPFVRFNATPNITLSASVSAGSTNTDLNVAGATSSFDSTQQLATFGVRGSWSEGNWTFAPAGGISYSVTRSDGFTDSNGNVNGSSTNRSGAINFGPTISYLHTLLDAGPIATITPSLGINGTYNYKHSGDVTFNNGVILTSDDLSASLSPGASLGFTNGTSASLGVTRSGIFSDVDGWSVTAGASAPVNLIFPGLGPDATTSFQFTADPQTGPGFMTRIVIPVF